MNASRQTPLERAFELAASGKYANVWEVCKRLRAEGHSTDQIVGRTLRQQLNAILKVNFQAREAPASSDVAARASTGAPAE
ncbi:MAG TPA: hypothetical protein VIL72_01890 [Beijerinckiaceae bacterium]|jgi:hypothetical protein